MSQKSADPEASYVTEYKTRNFKVSEIILGRWEDQEELLPENKDEGMDERDERFLSVHPSDFSPHVPSTKF